MSFISSLSIQPPAQSSSSSDAKSLPPKVALPSSSSASAATTASSSSAASPTYEKLAEEVHDFQVRRDHTYIKIGGGSTPPAGPGRIFLTPLGSIGPNPPPA